MTYLTITPDTQSSENYDVELSANAQYYGTYEDGSVAQRFRDYADMIAAYEDAIAELAEGVEYPEWMPAIEDGTDTYRSTIGAGCDLVWQVR